jgi:acetyltransferase-like isoleucine patch superfamily enzyme
MSLKGVMVGDEAIATKDIPLYNIYVGNPAMRIGFKFQKKLPFN